MAEMLQPECEGGSVKEECLMKEESLVKEECSDESVAALIQSTNWLIENLGTNGAPDMYRGRSSTPNIMGNISFDTSAEPEPEPEPEPTNLTDPAIAAEPTISLEPAPRLEAMSPQQPNSFSLNSDRATLSPCSFEIDQEIERINRFCEAVDENLRLIGQRTRPPSDNLEVCEILENLNEYRTTSRGRHTMSSSPVPHFEVDLIDQLVHEEADRHGRNRIYNISPVPIIDLSDLPSPIPYNTRPASASDDDVIIVSSDLDNSVVVDLCTPQHLPPVVPRDPPRHAVQRRRQSEGGRRQSEGGRRQTEGVRRQPEALRSARWPSAATFRDGHNVSYEPVISNATATTTSTASQKETSTSNSNNNDSSNDKNRVMCPVCMECALKRKPTSTKCGHVFCSTCIQQAIRITHKCPICKAKLTARSLIRIYV